MLRVTDRYLQQTFLDQLGKSRKSLNDLQVKIATQKEVQTISDNPVKAARISRLQNQLNDISGYKSNIETSKTYLTETTTAMTSMETEVQNVITALGTANNAINSTNLKDYAQKIDNSYKAIMQLANASSDGRYLFAGNSSSSAPFTSSDWYSVSNNLGGEQKINLSSFADQKVNITGEELFFPVVKETGAFDKSAAVGSTIQNTVSVADSLGQNYTVQMTYTKTADQQYSLQYDVKNSSNVSVGSGAKQLSFDAATGSLTAMDGSTPAKISVDIPASKVGFLIDTSGLSESTSSSLQGIVSQKANILNVLQSVRDNLAAGKQPTDAQMKIIQDFDTHLLNKLSEAGGAQNRMDAMSDMLTSQEQDLNSLLSKEQDVDVAKAVLEMQTAQYSTEMLYKASSMLLPKSLLDYL